MIIRKIGCHLPSKLSSPFSIHMGEDFENKIHKLVTAQQHTCQFPVLSLWTVFKSVLFYSFHVCISFCLPIPILILDSKDHNVWIETLWKSWIKYSKRRIKNVFFIQFWNRLVYENCSRSYLSFKWSYVPIFVLSNLLWFQ